MNYTTKPQESQGFSLSISDETAINKQQAGYLITYHSKKLNLNDKDELETIFTSRNYSFNHWEDNQTCSKDTYIGMHGIILDVDESMTIQEAKNTFSGYRYIKTAQR